MAEKDKKYYWLKLKRDFFKRHDIQIIEDMPNGKDYILFYLKLLCESVDHDGNLRFNEEIPYNEEMLSTITRTNIDTVRSAIKVFSQLQMMEILDNGTIFMKEVNKMLGSETYWAEQKRIQRKGKTLIGQSPTCPSKSIEIEKEIDKDTDIEIKRDKSPSRHKYGAYKNVLLSDEEYEKLQNEFPHDYSERIERLSEYIASTGKSYKNYLATIRAWSRRDKGKSTSISVKDVKDRQTDLDEVF